MPAISAAQNGVVHDLVLRGGTIYDGSGSKPFVGDVAVDGDRIAYVGVARALVGRREVDVHGRAIALGFINMLAHPEESLQVDGRALSDLTQGVTLEVMGEDSMGPLTPKMKKLMVERQGDIKYEVTWTTLGQYLNTPCSTGASHPAWPYSWGLQRSGFMCWGRSMYNPHHGNWMKCEHSSTKLWRRVRSA